MLRGLRRGRARARPAGRADDARRAAGARSARQARGFVYTVSVTGTTGERDGARRRLAAMLARAQGAHATCRSRVGFGISHARAGGRGRRARAPTA